jgi:hypothetical protein
MMGAFAGDTALADIMASKANGSKNVTSSAGFSAAPAMAGIMPPTIKTATRTTSPVRVVNLRQFIIDPLSF